MIRSSPPLVSLDQRCSRSHTRVHGRFRTSRHIVFHLDSRIAIAVLVAQHHAFIDVLGQQPLVRPVVRRDRHRQAEGFSSCLSPHIHFQRKVRAETYDLASLPELNDVDDLLPGHDRERQCRDYLRPSSVSQVVDRIPKDLGVITSELRVEESVGEQEVRGDGGRPVGC